MRGIATPGRIGNVVDMPIESLPNRLREWRKAAGLSLEELAARVGTNNTTLSRYERGLRSVTIDLLEQIAPHLECKAADLLPDPESVLDDRERRLIRAFEALDLTDQEALLRIADALEAKARGASVVAEPPRLPRIRSRVQSD